MEKITVVENNGGVLQGRIGACKCPYCKSLIDGFSAIDHNSLPCAGDYTVCCGCAELLIFNEDLTIRALNPLDNLEGVSLLALQQAQRVVRKMQEYKNAGDL